MHAETRLLCFFQALGDRLAEAFAEKLHADVRRKEWGYSKDEDMSEDDMLKVHPYPIDSHHPSHAECACIMHALCHKQ
jgi:5-methyltetrahydrofolate--homocysteine methyltransferase